MPETTPSAEQFAELARKELEAQLQRTEQERDEYRRVYLALLEAYRKLEAGLVGQKRERFTGGDEQLTMSLLAMLTGGEVAKSVADEPEVQQVPAHGRRKPTGRKPLPERLPRVHVEVLPPEVQRAGLDAFECIGEDKSETVEYRRASFVVVHTVRPKFIPKGKLEEMAATPVPADLPDDAVIASTPVLQAPSLELPIPRALCGPGLLSDTLVRRWQDHLPLHRLERIYGREGLELPRSTVCDWHQGAAALVRPLIDAMWKHALAIPLRRRHRRARAGEGAVPPCALLRRRLARRRGAVQLHAEA